MTINAAMHREITYNFKDINNMSKCTCVGAECDSPATVADTCGI